MTNEAPMPNTQSSSYAFWRIPKGFRNKAQGCEGRATLGKGARCFTTPTGLWPRCAAVAVIHNPFRVVIDRTHDPRVARSSQPWALLRNPFGILSKFWGGCA